MRTGATAAPATSTVTLAGTVESPWQTVLTQDLGLALAPKVAATAMAKTPDVPAAAPAAPQTLPLPIVGAALGGVAALEVLVTLVLFLRSRGPRLVGSLAISRGGVPVREFLLGGRSTDLAHASTPGLTGRVTPGRGGAAGVQVTGSAGGGRTRARLADGETVRIGDYDVTYTTQHTRTMSMIQAGHDEAGAQN